MKNLKPVNYNTKRTSYKIILQIKRKLCTGMELLQVKFMWFGKFRNGVNLEVVQKIHDLFQILTKEKFKQEVKK